MSPPPPAPWASTTGADGFGPFADLDVGGVVQRFRWCPPGRFWMGSPRREVGRSPREGPRHAVTLRAGFWMADSPVTQGLWCWVMGERPSHFSDPGLPALPVESVCWNHAQRLCLRLEERLQRAGLGNDGLGFRLPSEAEWEYACRAGAATATYAGDLGLRGEDAQRTLEPIAWCGGDGALGVALLSGQVPRRGADPGRPDRWAGTQPVKQKVPNPWGLYDTLGNVAEWCADAVVLGQGYGRAARVDPVGLVGERRALRGGSWFNDLAHARAAHRACADPAWRAPHLGLRLCRGRALPVR